MKEKLIKSVVKLMNIDISTTQAYLYFNMYITRSVFFESNIKEGVVVNKLG